MSKQTNIFQISAMIAGQLVSKTMRLYGRTEDIAKRINEVIPEADSLTVEMVSPSAFQNDRRINHGYDAACWSEHYPDIAL